MLSLLNSELVAEPAKHLVTNRRAALSEATVPASRSGTVMNVRPLWKPLMCRCTLNK